MDKRRSSSIRTHRVEDQQLGVVLLHGFTDTVISEGQALFVLLDEDESVAVAARRIKSRHNSIVFIVLGGLIDNGHRLAALVLIGKGQRRSIGKQSGKRKHQLTLAVTGVALQQCDLAEGNIRIPQPAHLLGYNALFIPYFLIGVGMLINVGLLFQGSHILWVIFCIVFFGTLGKAIAAYAACFGFRLPLSSGHMMFGLTSAHAAGSIAMVMVGMNLLVGPNTYLVNDDMLNGVVMMILCTCVISSMLTDWSSRKIILRDKELPDAEDTKKVSDEKILIPVKYPEYADNLMSLAFLVRNQKLNRGLVCLNVVYDDKDMRYKQEQGRQLLDHCSQLAAATDVMTQTQVRIAANIANGIKHAFNEFQCSEIIIGMHMHPEVSPKFWGEFHQSLFNGLSRQIIMARIKQPLNTIRRIQVAVPSRAEFEPGFYRWVERLARLSGNLDCRIQFHGREETLALINEYITNRHQEVRAEYTLMQHWNEMPQLASHMSKNHLFVVVTARKGTVSHKSALERLPEELTRFFSGTNLMIIFPDQHGDSSGNVLTFAEPQHQEEISAYVAFNQWFKKKFRK